MAATTANTLFGTNPTQTGANSIQMTTPSYASPVPAQAVNPGVLEHQGPQGFAPQPGVVAPVSGNHYPQQQQQQQQEYYHTQQYEPVVAPVANGQPPTAAGTASAQAAPAAGAKTSSLQGHLNKVKTQLEKNGGKQGAWLATQLQTQAQPFVQKTAIVGDINSNGTPIGFEVYRGSHIVSKDDIVKDMQGNPAYYLQFPHNIGSSWSLTFYRGGSPTGQPLATMRKQGSFGNPMQADDIVIQFAPSQQLPSGFTTTLARTSMLSSAHEFSTPTNERFKWKSESKLNSNDLMLIDLATGKVAATWEKSYVTYGKDGKLLVSPAFVHHLDLIVATGLCMEEWKREEAEKKGGGGMTSNKNLLGMGMKFLKQKK
ncbi:hypothetical protein OIV83_003032 [Microbotryomycetes sp. JL201]|nr:hypothetical protein OIV83_003032 [Microbotryomycetes sp. JL201]